MRTARINVAGNVTKEVSYKAEIDLCDEGKIKMLDAYTRIKPWKTLQFTIRLCTVSLMPFLYLVPVPALKDCEYCCHMKSCIPASLSAFL